MVDLRCVTENSVKCFSSDSMSTSDFSKVLFCLFISLYFSKHQISDYKGFSYLLESRGSCMALGDQEVSYRQRSGRGLDYPQVKLLCLALKTMLSSHFCHNQLKVILAVMRIGYLCFFFGCFSRL